MRVEETKLLSSFTTLGVGGPARWFAEATDEEEIAEAAAWAAKRSAAIFVLGGGSNLLASDAGFDGLVLRVGLRGIEVAEAADSSVPDSTVPVIYSVAAGEEWEHCVQQMVDDGCAGVECLAGIPGTVGGTPVQNVGAYGQEVSSVIDRVRAFDLLEQAFVELPATECGFGYRRSRFNTRDRARYVVTRVDFRLMRGGRPTVRYADLNKALAEEAGKGGEPSLADVAAAVRRVRRSKGMLLVDGDPDCKSAGSFFKNPVVTEEQFLQIANVSHMTPPRFPAGTDAQNMALVKVPAAWLIEQAGFSKGFAMGRAGISSRHTLALINRGGATAAEILTLAEQICSTVEGRFGIRLEMEPVMVGFQGWLRG